MTVATARREIDLEDLSGLPAITAIDRLRACELRPAIEPVDVTDPADQGHVIDHTPCANAMVRRGQLVTLLIGQASRPPESGPPASGTPPDAANDVDAVLGLPGATDTADPDELATGAGPAPKIVAEPRLTPVATPMAVRTAAPPGPPEHQPPRATPPVVWARRLGRRWLAGAAAAVIVAIAAGLSTAGPGRRVRAPEHAPANSTTQRPAPPPAAGVASSSASRSLDERAVQRARRTRATPAAPVRVAAHRPDVSSDERGVQRSHRTAPAAASAPSQPTSTSTVSSAPPTLPAVRLPGVPALADRQTTTATVLPPSPTGPLPGPYPNQP